jgi:two-component system chemotaxis response regulator CheB
VLALVLHRGPRPGALVNVLRRAGRLAVCECGAAHPPGKSCVHVAPPDAHLVFAGGALETHAGPKVHSARPAVDPLFESAARSYGPRVVGVVLSGSGSDGAAGLAAIGSAGGVTLVQKPEEAAIATMPLAAISAAHPDATLPLAEIARALEVLARGQPFSPRASR